MVAASHCVEHFTRGRAPKDSTSHFIVFNFNSYLCLAATELSSTVLRKAGGLCLSLYVRRSTRGNVCVLAVCTCMHEGMRGDTRRQSGLWW